MDRSSQLVIVALPSDNDHVRKVSSEKEPHLTLLYLGNPGFTSDQIKNVVEYVEHASSMLFRFGLDVKKRGELGPKKADVIFFDPKWSKQIEMFRTHLLRDNLISTAYQSAEQFPEWVPHLTMGFPDSPAKSDDRYRDSSYEMVMFDRIAVWTSDYEGPTFPLKDYDYDMEVAMSQIKRSPDLVDGILKHYGVKGMKWGVRRSETELDPAPSRPQASADSKAADAAQAKIKAGGTKSLSNNELQGLINRMNLERQYQTMVAHNKSSMDRGIQSTQKILKAGRTIEEVRRFLETPTGNAVKKGVKGAFAAAKVAAAFQTGGASSAAAAGTSIAVRRMSNHYTNGPR